MSEFKDAVADDVCDVFINPEEFADVHHLGPNQFPVACIIDKDITNDGGFDKTLSAFINGSTIVNTMTIYVPFNALPVAPVEGELFRVDGSLHKVQSVSIEDGVLVIVCEANEQ